MLLHPRRVASLLTATLVLVGCGGSPPSETGTRSSTTVVGTESAEPGTVGSTTMAEPSDGSVPPPTIGPSATTMGSEPAAASTTAPDQTGGIGGPADGCRRLTDFAVDDDNTSWVIVNDGVMGGRSAGAVDFVDDQMVFSGSVVTAGGGFTSVRYPLLGELDGTEQVSLRLRGDRRGYAITFENDVRISGRPVSYGARLEGEFDPGGWQVVTVPYDALAPTVFGRSVEAPAFDPGTGTEIGIIISDGLDGPFAVEVDWIDVCE